MGNASGSRLYVVNKYSPAGCGICLYNSLFFNGYLRLRALY